MNKELSLKVYFYILKTMNGYTVEELKDIDIEEIYCDPVFEGLLNIK